MIFYRNNIGFRQVSSNVQAQFLNSKSFVLQEMTGQDYQFSDTARDIMLHIYKVWTTALMEYEEYFVKEAQDIITDKMLEHCSFEIKQKLAAFGQHLKHNPEYYDTTFIKPFLAISGEVHKDLIYRFNKAFLGQKIILAYKDLGLLAINHLNHLLFVIHEIDNMVYNRDSQPFVYIDSVDVKALHCFDKSYTNNRLAIYRKFGILNTYSIALRVGINKELLDEDSNISDGYRKLYSKVEDVGYTITCTT